MQYIHNSFWCVRWVNSAGKVYKKAVDGDLSGDEENAYVLYMRFFNIMQEVAKTSKYQADKVTVTGEVPTISDLGPSALLVLCMYSMYSTLIYLYNLYIIK